MTQKQIKALNGLGWSDLEDDRFNTPRWQAKLHVALIFGIKTQIDHKWQLWDQVERTIDHMPNSELEEILADKDMIRNFAVRIAMTR